MTDKLEAPFEVWERRLRVRQRARDPNDADALEADIKAQIGADRARLLAERQTQADALETALRRAALPALDIETVRLEAQMGLMRTEGRVAAQVQAAQRASARAQGDLEGFRRRNDLRRPAAYPRSALMAIALLLVAALFESLFSASIFAAGSELGLLGGATIAIGLSGANVALGFLAGYLGLRYGGAREPARRAFGIACFLAAMTAAIALNVFAAGTREGMHAQATAQARLAAEPKIAQAYETCRARAERAADEGVARRMRTACERAAAARRAAIDPEPSARVLSFATPEAVILLMLGGAVWVFASLKGYSGVDDPYPDYGKFARLAQRLEDDHAERRETARTALEEPVAEANAAIAARLGAVSEALARRRAAFDEGAARLSALDARLRRLDEMEQRLLAQARRDAAPFPADPGWRSYGDALAGAGDLIAAGERAAADAQAAAAQTLNALGAALEAATRRLDGAPGEAAA